MGPSVGLSFRMSILFSYGTNLKELCKNGLEPGNPPVLIAIQNTSSPLFYKCHILSLQVRLPFFSVNFLIKMLYAAMKTSSEGNFWGHVLFGECSPQKRTMHTNLLIHANFSFFLLAGRHGQMCKWGNHSLPDPTLVLGRSSQNLPGGFERRKLLLSRHSYSFLFRSLQPFEGFRGSPQRV